MLRTDLFRVWYRATDTWVCFHKDMPVDCATANRVAMNMLLGCIREVAVLHADSSITTGYKITHREGC